jgi:hypothetical protein
MIVLSEPDSKSTEEFPMNKQSKPAPQPFRKEFDKSKTMVPPAGPSVDANHQPVSENDNSANLFEENIKTLKKDESC